MVCNRVKSKLVTTISFRILYGVYFRIEEIHALFQLFFTFSGVLRALTIGFTDVTLPVSSHGCYRQAPWCSVYRIGKYLSQNDCCHRQATI